MLSMDAFTQSLLQYHGNGKHKQNWNYLNEIFQFNILLVEEAALQKNEETGVTVLLSYAHEISNSFRASLIVTLMLMYQMENLNEESYDVFISEVSNFFDYITPQEAECASEECKMQIPLIQCCFWSVCQWLNIFSYFYLVLCIML